MEEKTEDNLTDVAAIQRDTLEKLRPHFIFNTLNAIRYQMKEQPEVAYDMVYDLGKYLRGSCKAIVGKEWIPVEEELGFAKAYARLEEIQKNRLTVSWQVLSDDGWVEAGSIYTAVEALLKQEVYTSREPRTLVVTGDREQSLIRVYIKENGKELVIPVQKEKGKTEEELKVTG